MRFIHTNGSDPVFVDLCSQLDDSLNVLAQGIANRQEYTSYNKLDDIHDVVLAYDGKMPIACASFKNIKTNVAEVKRVFVVPQYQGRGIAKEIMYHLEERAKLRGYRELILETGKDMNVAIGLYHSLGYSTISNYGQYKDMDKSVCMKKIL